MNLRGLMRMALWARRPPSEARVRLVLAVLAICLALFGFERVFGWPDWLTPGTPLSGRAGY